MFARVQIKRVLLVGFFVVTATFIFMFAHFHHYLDNDNFIRQHINRITDRFTNWIEGEVLGISYEERFCRHIATLNASHTHYPPVEQVSRQLGISNTDSVFINGLHCGEWALALRRRFPNIRLYGVDKDADSIAYVNKLVNGTYRVSSPFELQKVEFDTRFDHAIIDGVLSIYPADWQCKSVKQTIPMLKAGGSLYIGKNFEQGSNTQIEHNLMKHSHVRVLPACYWSSVCLRGRSDIVEVLYSREISMIAENAVQTTDNLVDADRQKLLLDFSRIATSVFVYKHILFNRDAHLFPDSRYEHRIHNHACTYSETKNKTRSKISIDIKKAVKDMQLKGLSMN